MHAVAVDPHRRINAVQVRHMCGGVTDMTLWRWLRERDFPKPIYIGQLRYWREADVVAWLDRQPTEPTK